MFVGAILGILVSSSVSRWLAGGALQSLMFFGGEDSKKEPESKKVRKS